MSGPVNEWTLEGFVDHFGFVHQKMPDHKFVWILGAGASFSSGIPLGSTLVDEWLKELHLKEDRSATKTALANWATTENLKIKDFKYENRASFYSKVYERRFRNYPDEGYAYLESVMSKKDPSPGYSILAAALAADPPRHNAVITTNFDNLIADALSIYTDTFPFVCGHESLTGFVRVAMRRPLICKIHRDLLLAPQNDHRSLTRLKDAWGLALCSLFQHYTPLFIGYGGNDDTLMDLLAALEPGDIKGQLIWCYHESGKPSERIVNVVADHKGVLVPVPDFDLLMVMIGEKLGINLLDQEILVRARQRTRQYRDRIKNLDTVAHPAATKALASLFDRSGGWFAWYRKALLEKDPSRCEIVCKQGFQHYPNSSELCNNVAILFWERCRNRDEADKAYRRSIELGPVDASPFANYAEFLIQHDRLPEAREIVQQGKTTTQIGTHQDACALTFLEAIIATLQGKSDAEAVEDLRLLLASSFPREDANFKSLLEYVKGVVSDETYELYAALGAAILDPAKVATAEVVLANRAANTSKRKCVSTHVAPNSRPKSRRKKGSDKRQSSAKTHIASARTRRVDKKE